MIPRLVLTTGEPAGVGPDIVLQAAMTDWPAELVALGCKKTLAARARQLGLPMELKPFSCGAEPSTHKAGALHFIDLPLPSPCVPGQLNSDHSEHVLAQLELATELCRAEDCNAMVTAPVHKGVINDAGIPFSGHTEFLAEATGAAWPVMLLTNGNLKVALATTHLALRAVPEAITAELLEQTIRAMDDGLKSFFGIADPRITVLGLNPHAGEDGYLGREELDVIAPICSVLRADGLNLTGPISGDTAFNSQQREQTDAYLAMFHDQGLPVIKAEGFGGIVNVTLGLPIVRTSVDHGTALALSGTGKANVSSMRKAVELAIQISRDS